MDSVSLKHRLAKELPNDTQFLLHHLSTPPTECPAIFAAAPGQDPDKTFRENQFLSISIEHENRQLQVFAIEVFIYTTHRLTTLFVSKADSTGYLHLLGLPKDQPSPLKTIATEFLQFLITDRTRSDRRLVLSLFARAQDQYLFPGSVESGHKHILDDRGLIKWWCQIVDSILLKHIPPKNSKEGGSRSDATISKGYLRVPGYDVYGTKTFFPKASLGVSDINARWKVADPLRELVHSTDMPERCLIPRFPDDPKARYVETLDEELPIGETSNSQTASLGSTRGENAGRWRSIKSLDQFWEAMSFRQECSSGRLVGFLWAVFEPDNSMLSNKNNNASLPASPEHSLPLPNLNSQDQNVGQLVRESGDSPTSSLNALQTPSPSSQTYLEPLTPTPVKVNESKVIALQPVSTDHFYWPNSSRGEIVLRERDYDRVGKMLLRLDYSGFDTAGESTDKWIKDVARKAGIAGWGKTIVGERKMIPTTQQAAHGENELNFIGAGLIRKKKRPANPAAHVDANEIPGCDDLAASLMRKRPKINGAVTS